MLLGTTGRRRSPTICSAICPTSVNSCLTFQLDHRSNMLLINPDVRPKTVPEFVAWLKDNKGKIAYASSVRHLHASFGIVVPEADRPRRSTFHIAVRRRDQRPDCRNGFVLFR